MIKRVRYRGALPEARTKAQAEHAAAQVRLQVYQGKYGVAAGTTGFIAFAEQVWLPWSRAHKRSARCDETHLKIFRAFFGKKTFSEITPLLLEKFKHVRRQGLTCYGTKRQPASVNRELAALSKIFSLALRDGVTNTNPVRLVTRFREDNLRHRTLTVAEEARLLAALEFKPLLRSVVVVALHTGMRKGEILGLRWSHVDFLRNVVWVTQTKSGKDRIVPMNAVVRAELLRWQTERQSEFVFTNPETGVALTDFKKSWQTACRVAQIEDFHFHDLRHTAATRMADAGADAFTIAALLGHSDLKMTQRYTHATDSARQRAVEALANYGANAAARDGQQGQVLEFVPKLSQRQRG
jgi:integrase